MSDRGRRRVGIVGAGWSGLAAAVGLVERSHSVMVFEAASGPGGRARDLVMGGNGLDNGQHLLLGAYRRTLAAMRTVGADPLRLFERLPLDLSLRDRTRAFRLTVPPGPALPALALALVRARGPRVGERLRALLGAHRLRRPLSADRSVADWLPACGQSPGIVADLWTPLCLAAMNLAPERASARVFARVLRETFSGDGAADLLLPRTDLGRLFPRPAVDWLRNQGAYIHFGRRVRGLAPVADGWCVRTTDSDETVDDVIIATDPAAAARLLAEHPATAATAGQLRALGGEPIVTVWLQYAASVRLPLPMTGRLDGPAHWLFDRALTGHPGLIGAVISGDGPHMALDRDKLARDVTAQVSNQLPGAPKVVGVVREKRATFACTVDNAGRRPDARTALPGIWLAGDCVDNGLPATLEGAVRNGLDCAARIDRQYMQERAG